MANAGRHLYASQNLNQMPQQYEDLPLSLLTSRVDRPAAQAADTASRSWVHESLGRTGYGCTTLRPFPQYNGVGIYGSTYGNSNYQSLPVQTRQAMRAALPGPLLIPGRSS